MVGGRCEALVVFVQEFENLPTCHNLQVQVNMEDEEERNQ